MKARLKLIVGLGNPGEEYRLTRHNVGARAVAKFAQKHGFFFRSQRPFQSFVAEGAVGDTRVMLMLPQTFMNLSGSAVGAAAEKRSVPLQDILIVYDDTALPLGSLRVRPLGSDGGHRGLASVIGRFKTEGIARLRLGVAGERPKDDLAGYVLSPFSKHEETAVEKMLKVACEAMEVWAAHGILKCMNQFNAAKKKEPRIHEQV